MVLCGGPQRLSPAIGGGQAPSPAATAGLSCEEVARPWDITGSGTVPCKVPWVWGGRWGGLESPSCSPWVPRWGAHGGSTAQCPSQMEGWCPLGQTKGGTPRPQAKGLHSIPSQRGCTSLHRIPTQIGPPQAVSPGSALCQVPMCHIPGPRPQAEIMPCSYTVSLYSVPIQHPVPCPRVLCQVPMQNPCLAPMQCPHSQCPPTVPIWGLCHAPMPVPCAIPRCHAATQCLVPCPPVGTSPASPHAVHCASGGHTTSPRSTPAFMSRGGLCRVPMRCHIPR